MVFGADSEGSVARSQRAAAAECMLMLVDRKVSHITHNPLAQCASVVHGGEIHSPMLGL